LSVFVDTSAWYALLDQGDGMHERASQVLQAEPEHILTDHVLVETWFLASSRLGLAVADRFLEEIINGAAAVEVVGMRDIERALGVRRRFSDQAFSLVDCTSFVVMERMRLRRVAAFDNDFAIYRYGHDGRQAFEIVR
jgi:predicted nucleic acid-binding protein